MNRAINYLGKNQWIFYLLAFVLLIPALFINIGLAPYSSDEPIRALVSLEMKLSGEYFNPTLGGIHYFYKPPLYNWILLIFFRIFGSYNEWVVRMPAIFSLFLFALMIYTVFKNKIGREFAVLSGFFLITCGDILFWDSLLGLIDITYSLVTFIGLFSIYHYYQKKNHILLFLVSYLMMTIGFMMKGLPSIAFQGITLLVYFIYKRDFKKLFSLQHCMGILVFIVIVGGYFWIYSKKGDVKEYLLMLFNQSSRRTVASHGWIKTVLHVFNFPLGWLYHFAPWTLLIITCIRRDFMKILKENDLLMFSLLVFFFNILVYWTSPEFHPRYILMLLPFAYYIFIVFYIIEKKAGRIRLKILEIIFFITCVLSSLSFLIYPFYSYTRDFQFVTQINIFLFIVAISFTVVYIKIKQIRLIVLVIILLLVRIGFNLFLHPVRVSLSDDNLYKRQAIEIAKLTKNEPVHIFRDTPVHEITLIYITRGKQQIVQRQYRDIKKDIFYIINEEGMKGTVFRNYYNIKSKWSRDKDLHLVKFLELDGLE